jgi:cobyrinic acid a,c-diamide synthase
VRLSAPRLVVAGLCGDSGKTLVTLGLGRALLARGIAVAPFKKGPDYIDAAWLGEATGRPGRNLDTFLHDDAALGEALRRGLPADLMLIEGNRGLFDGLDALGTHSTATLARRLRAPVLLVVDVTKATRTVAAMVRGCQWLDPEVRLAGVILNRVATMRQESLIREALASAGGPPVLGAVPRIGSDPLPSRHLGLVTPGEHTCSRQAVQTCAELAQKHLDLDGILAVSNSAPTVELPAFDSTPTGPPVRIGVLKDEAFCFYYPENLERLREAGVEIVLVSPLADTTLPEVDALYAGGGFPEVHAARLSENGRFRQSLAAAVADGLPVYAECGGLMYLARELRVAEATYPMVGALDLIVELTDKPCGHGYAVGTVDRPNPFFEPGTVLRGHEFHYSRVVGGASLDGTALALERGTGVAASRDAVVTRRVWASYLHVHALGTPGWAGALVAAARRRRRERQAVSTACA